MPDFGIGETMLALGAFGGEAALEGGAALGAEAGLFGGLGEFFGFGGAEAAGGLFGGTEAAGGLFGGAEAAGVGQGLAGLGEAAGGLAGAEVGGVGQGLAGLGEAAGGLAGAEVAGGAPLAELAGGAGGVPKLGAGIADLAGGAQAGAKPAGEQGLFDKLIGGIQKDPLKAGGVGLGAAALGYNMLQGNPNKNEIRQLKGDAYDLGMHGKEMMGYLQAGNLPPGLQAELTKKTEAARARIIQNHAKNGMPIDPSQNSALAQELNNVDQQAMIETAQIGERLMQVGLKEVGMADELWTKLIALDRQQAAGIGGAIANFAAALAGGRNNQQRQQA